MGGTTSCEDRGSEASRLPRRVPLLALCAAAALSLASGPCGPIPGGELSAPEATEAVEDWSFANQVPRCAVEVLPDTPRSVTVNCMSWDDRLFVSCSSCEVKQWAAEALSQPAGRVQVGEQVYPVDFERVTEPETLAAVWSARLRKLESDPTEPRPDDWWTFELRSREP